MSSQPARADPFAALNPEQRTAVEHGLNEAGLQGEALLVIAGAGSGKTLTLASRVARLVLAGADPQRILLLTFSRRAAQEMERRVGRTLHAALRLRSTAPTPTLPWAGTFHSVGARLLRAYASNLGLSESFTIHDRADAEDLMGMTRQELGLAATKSRFPLKGTCLSIYSRTLNSQASLEAVLQDAFPWCASWAAELKRLFTAYASAKHTQQVLDYDDLLLYWANLMADPALAKHLGARFDHVLVDEYQDTNRLQASILLALRPGGRGLTVVGDDAQSIYSFRAAEVRNILDFPKHFTPSARIVTLERNYRSTQRILDASNAVIDLAAERFSKRLWTDRASSVGPRLVTVQDEMAQARWVADRVLEHREAGLPLKSQAVLFRASHHSAGLELELARRNIPFVKFGGLKFLEAAHVKDVLSVLRWAENPRSRLAGFRVAQLIPGIGPASARRLVDAMEEASDPATVLMHHVVPPPAREDWNQFVSVYCTLRATSARWPAEVELVTRWYGPHLLRLYDDAPARQADLDQLARIASAFTSRERFLTELTLDPPEATSDQSGPPHLDEDYLILSTIHSAKGQEWSSVHVLNVVDGCIPSDMGTGNSAQIDEERRLLYVAMTRAKEHLELVVPQRFYVTQQRKSGDRHLYGSLSRFIPPSVGSLFEHASPGSSEEAVADCSHERLPVIDVAARMQAIWE